MIYFIVAILLLLSGHVVRAIRWSMLFPKDSVSRPSTLLVALSLSYLLNLFITYRLSEIARIIYVTDRQKIRFAPVISSVLLERLSDCIVLIGIGLLFTYFSLGSYLVPLYILLIVSILLIAFAVIVNKSQKARTFFWKMTWFFNDNIRIACIEIAWTFAEAIKDRILLSKKYLLLTVCMWSIYCASYYFLSKAFIGYSVFEITKLIFESPQFFTSYHSLTLISSGLLLLYILAPLLIALTYAVLSDRSGFVRTLGHIARGRGSFNGLNSVAVPENFKDYQNYSIFLRSLFQGKNSIISLFGMKAIDDGIVNRIFHGGSGALIAQVQVRDKIFIRKFAIDAAGRKLAFQSEWMKQHSAILPMVEIVNEQTNDAWFYYDMPYSSSARDFYEIIHAADVNKSKVILDEIITTLQQLHQNTEQIEATNELVSKYISSKVIDNINLILEKVEPLINFPSFTINGHTYDINDWDFLKKPNLLLEIFKDRRVSEIHGDLTIENVIIDSSVEKGWFFIDPNPENVFNSPLIDWAKMFQSLHLGYEIINKGISCKIHNNDIRFFSPRTMAYQELYEHLCMRLGDQYGEQVLKEVYLHEIINYLRLTPYKFNYGSEPGLLFFANTCILIDEFRNRYGIA